MKCFEITYFLFLKIHLFALTVNMKCFEIIKELRRNKVELKLTVNMKCFEILIMDKYYHH